MRELTIPGEGRPGTNFQGPIILTIQMLSIMKYTNKSNVFKRRATSNYGGTNV